MHSCSPDSQPLAASLTLDEWAALCAELSEPRFRADQIWQWIQHKGVENWDEMLNLPKTLRAALAERVVLPATNCLEIEGSPRGTRKLLIGLRDDQVVETVIIPARGRRTVCVSTQAGCAYACAFCASGMAGLTRDLETGEIVEQVLEVLRLDHRSPTHVVFMGIGEPLANYDNVLTAIRMLNHPKGLGIGVRRITVSTCGVVPGIERLATENLQVELSVSLHAADDALREELMPVNRKYPLKTLIPACDAYTEATGRIITYEYTLVRDLNDEPEHADALVTLLHGHRCRVNLIPLSPVEEFDGRPPRAGTAGMFVDTLLEAGVNATVRQSRGAHVDAACGQLRLHRRKPNRTQGEGE